MARGGGESLFYESRSPAPRSSVWPKFRASKWPRFPAGRCFARCLDAARGRDIFVRYILRGVNPGPSVRPSDGGSVAGFHFEFLLSKRQRSGVTGRCDGSKRRQRNSVTSVGEGREFLRNYLETHALPTTLFLAISLPLSFYLVSVLE